MKRRAFLQAIAALPIVAALAPLVPAPVARVFQTPTYDITPPPVKPRYLRAKMTWPYANFRHESVASLTGLEGQPVTFWIPGSGVAQVEVEGSDDGISWRPAPDAVGVDIQMFEP